MLSPQRWAERVPTASDVVAGLLMPVTLARRLLPVAPVPAPVARAPRRGESECGAGAAG